MFFMSFYVIFVLQCHVLFCFAIFFVGLCSISFSRILVECMRLASAYFCILTGATAFKGIVTPTSSVPMIVFRLEMQRQYMEPTATMVTKIQS